MGIEVSGLLGLIVLVLDIWAILKIIDSGVGTGARRFGSWSFCSCRCWV